jgi:hypothetical protein
MPIDVDDRDQRIAIGVQRQTRRFATTALAPSGAALLTAQSRLTRYAITSHLPLTGQVAATLGWQGMKLSNRNANVTATGGKDRLRSRDFFLPAVAISVAPASAVTLTLDYAESVRAYGGTGITGPLGLTDTDYRALRRTLRPETQSRARMRAEWAVAHGTALSIAVQGGRLDDRLGFATDSLLPVNTGNARIMGTVMRVRQQVGPHLGLTLGYSDARLRMDDGADRRERSLALGAAWRDGPFHAAFTLTRGSVPALAALPSRPTRMEASLDYAALSLGGRPLRLGLQLTDPDQQAGGRFARDEAILSLRPADQARALLATARLDW